MSNIIKGYKTSSFNVGTLSLNSIPLTTYRSHARLVNNFKAKRAHLINTVVEPNLKRTIYGRVIPNFYKNLYNRIIIIPHVVSLGNISSLQVFEVTVWNAFKHEVNLSEIKLFNTEGIELKGHDGINHFGPISLKKWTVYVNMQGPADIDAKISWIFENTSATLSILGSRTTDWTFSPNWDENIVENLEFLTSVYQSISGAEQRVSKRLSPRRTLEFKVSLSGKEKQLFENFVYSFGSRIWSIPIFYDKTSLHHAVSSGDTQLFLDTTGYDFSETGRILITNGKIKETLEITEIKSGTLFLKRPILNRFDNNADIYPLRSAVLTDMPVITKLTDGVSTSQIRLLIHEHNAWSKDISHLPIYRQHPVLEPTSSWHEDISAQYLRMIKTLDNGTGLPTYFDTASKAFQLITHHFVATNRDEQQKLRQLFYYLNGRQKPIWVSSSSSDFDVLSDIKGKIFYVKNIGFTETSFNQVGRKDIRIEWTGGVLYKRIKSATLVDENTEMIGLDTEDLNISKDNILKISFLTLSRLESDTVTFKHITDSDGLATVTVNFRGLRDELENAN